MTDSPTPHAEDTSQPASVDELAAQFQAAREERAEIAERDAALKRREQEIVWLLYEGRTWAEVGKILGFTGSRAEAIARRR
jgi:DNA-directed RNA polymerase specialized sigma subunit